MKLVSSKKITDHFDQSQIDELEQALRRAWEAVQHMDIAGGGGRRTPKPMSCLRSASWTKRGRER